MEIEISYFEIYNERIYDLLSASSGSGGLGGDHREPLRVREHPENGPYVEGVARHLISSYDDLQVKIGSYNCCVSYEFKVINKCTFRTITMDIDVFEMSVVVKEE